MKKQEGSIPWKNYRLVYIGISDKGKVRQINEDAFLISPENHLFCVADGMGGHSAGDVASRLTLESMAEFCHCYGQAQEMSLKSEASIPGSAPELLEKAIQYANLQVYKAAAGRLMGSTVVAACFTDKNLLVAHVGDSRVYQLRNGTLRQITEDHSLVYELYKQGSISYDEMQTHPKRNIITRAIGPDEKVKISQTGVDTTAGDLYLLCSDGLTSMLDNATIASILTSDLSLSQKAITLVDRSNDAAGNDNITVLLIAIE